MGASAPAREGGGPEKGKRQMAKCSDTRQAQWKGWLALVAVAALAGAPAPAGAQPAHASGAGASPVVNAGGPYAVNDVIEVVPAGCSTCANGLLGAPPPGPSIAPVPGVGCPSGA